VVQKGGKLWTQLKSKVWVETKTVNNKKLQVVTKDNHNKEITKIEKKRRTVA